jgi:hypothetical protein
LWLAYNLGVYGNALEFANGPYSAKAIAQRTTSKGAPPYPGKNHPWTAAIYFVKTAQLECNENVLAKLLFAIAVVGTVGTLRSMWLPTTLLWTPLVFYALSIAYGSVPIFIPVWWPFSYYNVRYGLELLPAIAAGAGLVVVVAKPSVTKSASRIAAACVLLLTAVCYWQAWRSAPVCLREVRVNGQARMELDQRLATVLGRFTAPVTVLAYTGSHSGAFQDAGLPLGRTINEGNLYYWDVALLSPALAADYAVASDGDPVALAIAAHPNGMAVIESIQVEGQPRTVVYQSTVRAR